jgi:uncharacterized membrane protein YdjX (TVP38/TMEM64 family)
MSHLKRLAPLLLILAALALAYALGLQRQLSWTALAAHQAALRTWVQAEPLATAAGYVAVYTLAVAASFPGAIWITITGGLMFGTKLGAALAVCGSTLGAILLFLAARSALGPFLERRAGRLLDRLRPGLQRDGFLYVLALRLIPVMPFWLINLAAALSGVRLSHFIAATVIGIIPAVTVFASIGAGIGGVLAAGQIPDISIIFSPTVLLALLGLAALALLPVGWRYWSRKNA